LDDYGIDSTEDTCTTLKEVVAAMKTKLHHQTVRYHILSQLATNTVVAVGATKISGDARSLLKYVPPGSTAYMDADLRR
jgi:hypothetical protein